MTVIYYNNVNAFSDCIGTPLLSIDIGYNYVNKKLSRIKTVSLRGKLKKDACSDGFSALYAKQQSIIAKFRENFKQLKVEENGQTIFQHDYAIVRSVNFDESSYANLITVNVVIDCYDYNYADNGVLSPKDSVDITNNPDGTQSITRNLSCIGINDSTSFVDNALNFLRNPPANTLVPGGAILVSRQEKINRHTGNCSIAYQYIYDPNNRQGVSNRGVLTYTIDINQDQDKVEIGVSGEVRGGMDCSIQNLRDSFNYINWFNLCSSEYSSYYDDGALSEAPINFSTNENSNENTLSFNISYDNMSQKDAYIVDTVSVSRDFTSGLTCVSVKIDFICDFGCKKQRWNNVNALYSATDIEEYAINRCYDYTSVYISNTFKSKSISFDENNARISASISYCDDYLEDCGCIKNFEYAMQFSPSITKYAANQTINGNGCYNVQNLGYKNRSRFSISGRYNPTACCSREDSEKQLLSRINFITSLYFPAEDKIIESKTIDYDEFGVVSFSFSFNGILGFDEPTAPPAFLLLEDGNYVLLENGEKILFE